MKIGILGGTFNPIHIGHIRLGVEAKEQLSLDEVHFVPSFLPPHKKSTKLLPFEIRCRFVELSISHISGFKVNKIEQKRDGPSYTFYTLEAFLEIYQKEELFFILGGKDFTSIYTWYRWKELFDMCNFITAGTKKEFLEIDSFLKNSFSSVCFKNSYWKINTTFVYFISIPELKISSSLIREKIKNGLSISYLVPPIVEKEIRQEFEKIL